MVVGKEYAISFDVDELSCSSTDTPNVMLYDGGVWWSAEGQYKSGSGHYEFEFVYKQPFPDHANPNAIYLFNTPGPAASQYHAVFRNVMLVEGTTPAAWAPAERDPVWGC